MKYYLSPFHPYLFLEHINHIKDIAGVDHVGLGSDYRGFPDYYKGYVNGTNGFPRQIDDESDYPNLFVKLLEQVCIVLYCKKNP